MGGDKKRTFYAEVFSWCLPDIYLKKIDGFLLAVQPSFWVYENKKALQAILLVRPGMAELNS